MHPGTKALKAQQANRASPAPPSSATSSRPAVAPNLSIRTNVYQAGPDGKSSQVISEKDAVQAVKGSLIKEGEEGGDTTMAASADAEHPLQYTCDVCGSDCTATRYHSIRKLKPDSEDAFDICPACYNEGRFPSNLFSGDFLRLDSATMYRKPQGTAWSDQETLLLLEGLEMFNDDWDKVSEHVGSRSREECVAHFLQLPIEDEFLVQEGGAMANASSRLGTGFGRVDRLPFTQPDHPVLGVVAFLASVVDPEVAARAASESVKELTETLKKKSGKREESTTATAPQEDTTMAGDKDAAGGAAQTDSNDSMAVDGADTAAEAPSTSSQPETNGEARDDVKKEIPHRAASIALASAATKAHLLAQQTSAELTSQIHKLVSTQVSKLNLKLAQFESLESSLDTERRQLETAKQLLQMERIGIEKQLEAIAEVTKKVAAGEQASAQELERLRSLAHPNGTPAAAGGTPATEQQQQGQYRSGMPPKVSPVNGAEASAPLNDPATATIQPIE